jgi:hypothetical protein
MVPALNKTHHTHENIDQSGRHARPHRWTRTGHRLRCGQLQGLQGLRKELQLLREVLGWQVCFLLQVTRSFNVAEVVLKKPASAR